MTRDEILEAAVQIFSQKGFHATSMQDIAQSVNLQKASLYHHISSKQEILVAVLDRALDMLVENMQCVMERQLPTTEKLYLATKVYLSEMLENRELASVLLLEHRSLKPEYQDIHIPRRDKFENLWRELLEQGVAENEFECEDPAITARAILGVLNWSVTWYRSNGKLSPQEISDQFVTLFLYGLIPRTT